MARTAGETTPISLLREIRKLYIKDFLSLKQISDKLKKDPKFKNLEGLSPNNLDSIIQRLKKTDIQGVPKFTTLELKTRPVYGARNVVDNLEKVKQVKKDAATMSRKDYLEASKNKTIKVPLQNDQISRIKQKHGLKFGIVEKGKAPQLPEVPAGGRDACEEGRGAAGALAASRIMLWWPRRASTVDAPRRSRSSGSSTRKTPPCITYRRPRPRTRRSLKN